MSWTTEPITDKQVGYLYVLCKQLGISTAGVRLPDLTKGEAKSLIDALKASVEDGSPVLFNSLLEYLHNLPMVSSPSTAGPISAPSSFKPTSPGKASPASVPYSATEGNGSFCVVEMGSFAPSSSIIRLLLVVYDESINDIYTREFGERDSMYKYMDEQKIKKFSIIEVEGINLQIRR